MNQRTRKQVAVKFSEAHCHCEESAFGGRRSNHDFGFAYRKANHRPLACEIASLPSVARNDDKTLLKNQKTKEIVVATRNKKKLAEIKELTKDLGLMVLSLEDFPDAPYVREDGKTFSDNADKKALKIARFSGRLTLGEDSGLCIDALGGAPGIASARFSGKDKSDLKNNLKVLRLLEGLPAKKRSAHYVCAVSIADKNGLVGRSEGKCPGIIGFEMKGSRGFGYDPIFVIPKYKKTFAQLGEEIKHTMSHRYKALKKTKLIVQKYFHGQSPNC